MAKEKLTCKLNQMLIEESTDTGLNKIMEIKDRSKQEVVRYFLKAGIKRLNEGKIKDDELY